MPLKKGSSKKVISKNIGELVKSYEETGKIGTSHPKSIKKAQEQAAAIAYDKARASGAKIPKPHKHTKKP